MPEANGEIDPPAAVLDDALIHLAERYSPTVQPPFIDLVSRRRHRTWWHAGVTVAVAVLAVGAVGLSAGLPFAGPSTDPRSTTPDQSGVDVGPLVADGACADLNVNAQWQGRGGPLIPIGPGPAVNTVTMPANSLLYLQAAGSCVERLRFHTDSALLQGATSLTGGTFNADGISVVISRPGLGGTATLELFLDCPDASDCADARQPLAELTVEITASNPDPTAQPGAERPELGDADWTLATTPAATDTVVPLIVEERACASGRSAQDRIVSEVEYTQTAILVSLSVEPLAGDQTCPDNPPTPYDLHLTEPVGDRAVIPRE